MALTVANVEAILVNRLSARLTYVGYSVLTTGSNPNLADPIRRSYVFTTGLTPASLATIADADLANVTDSPTFERLCDAAQLATLRIILGQLTEVDAKAGDGELRNAQLMTQILAEIKDLEEALAKPSGAFLSPGGMGSLTAGVPMPNDPFNPCRQTVPVCYPQQGMFPLP
jgi:hypothetical protein